MSEFSYNPALAEASLALYRGLGMLTGGRIRTWAEPLAQAQVASLVHAELVAAHAGVVPLIETPMGPGVLTIGAARARIDQAPADVRTLYLATHGAVRQSIAMTRPAGESAAREVLPATYYARAGDERAIIVPLIVLGVAALAAGAYYATGSRKAQLETEADKAKAFAQLAECSKLAQVALRTSGSIPPELAACFQPYASLAAEESTKDGPPWKVIAGAVAVVAITGTGLYFLKTLREVFS